MANDNPARMLNELKLKYEHAKLLEQGLVNKEKCYKANATSLQGYSNDMQRLSGIAREKKRKLSQKQVKLNAEVDSLNSKYKDADNAMKSVRSRLISEINKANKIETDFRDCKRYLGFICDIHYEVWGQSSELRSLKAEIQNHTGKMGRLKEDIQNTESHLNNASTDLSLLNENIYKHEQSIAETDSNIVVVKKKLSDLATAKMDYSVLIARLDGFFTELPNIKEIGYTTNATQEFLSEIVDLTETMDSAMSTDKDKGVRLANDRVICSSTDRHGESSEDH
ncbi:hypothetical protein BOW53_16255 [Solemya pervernicosa gill symbiont]|uniref:Uncharacterized protein n=2 Tax=Solemya pervernicosa gill symbiont TaxID=642797 RepID=A0A1T2KZD7_9GAMM|nr:hypothetical protein BOW53_16255 [Solemya pervernicosa gill symbiont]